MTPKTRVFAVVATCVLILHVAALWALQAGLVVRDPAAAAPVHLLARMVAPPKPIATLPQRPVAQTPVALKATPPERKSRPTPTKPAPVAKPSPQQQPDRLPATFAFAPTPTPTPTPTTTPTPTNLAPMPNMEPAQIPTVPSALPTVDAGEPVAPGNTAPVGSTPQMGASPAASVVAAADPRPAATAIELPSSVAQYLQNPRPRYPPISLRLREQGTVLIDVLVSERGLASKAKVKTSSGFFRLDNVAVSTVLTWHFIPGKRAGVAQAMWYTVPITFTIQ